MFIINLIKKLMGQAQEKVAKSTTGIAGGMGSAIDKASKDLDNYLEKREVEIKEKQVMREAAQKEKELTQIRWQDRVTIGEKTYKVNVEYKNNTLHESTDGGKHWTFVNAVPLYKIYGLSVADDGGLAIGGRFLESTDSLWQSIKKDAVAMGAGLLAGTDKAYDAVPEAQDFMSGGWSTTIRAFRLDETGVMLVDTEKDSMSNFSPVPHMDTTMIIGSPSYTDALKDVLKAAGQKGAEKVEIRLRNFAGQKEVLFSLDGVQWRPLEGDLPKDFTGFEHYNNITVATTNGGKRYFYYDREWRPIDFEADLEFEKNDAPKAYKLLEAKDVNYHYMDANDYKHDVGTTKMVHLLICDGEKGVMGFDSTPDVFYIANDHVRQDEFDNGGIHGYAISEVENIGGEVVVTSHDKKHTYHQIFHQEGWASCGGDHVSGSLTSNGDDIDQASLSGPYCFESTILDDDPLWDKVDSPITEYPLDAKGKEVAKGRKIIIKVTRKHGTGEAFFYLNKEGQWTFLAPHAGGNPFWSLYSTGKPSPRYDKNGNLLCYDLNPMIYYAANSDEYFRWTRKKKGLIKKEIVYEWEKVDPIALAMLGKVHSKK